jgi:hypothetical protein
MIFALACLTPIRIDKAPLALCNQWAPHAPQPASSLIDSCVTIRARARLAWLAYSFGSKSQSRAGSWVHDYMYRYAGRRPAAGTAASQLARPTAPSCRGGALRWTAAPRCCQHLTLLPAPPPTTALLCCCRTGRVRPQHTRPARSCSRSAGTAASQLARPTAPSCRGGALRWRTAAPRCCQCLTPPPTSCCCNAAAATGGCVSQRVAIHGHNAAVASAPSPARPRDRGWGCSSRAGCQFCRS